MSDPPLAVDVRHPLLLKAGDLCVLTQQTGDIDPRYPGFGLFFRDTCYLSGYGLRLHGAKPILLATSDAQGMAAQISLTNHTIKGVNGRDIEDHSLGLERTLLVLEEGPSFIDTISIRNFGEKQQLLPVSLHLGAKFENLFVLRGSPTQERGRLLAPEWNGAELRFTYEGADQVRRSLLVQFSVPLLIAPRTSERSAAHFDIVLDPQETKDLVVTIRVDERDVAEAPPAFGRAFRNRAEVRQAQDEARRDVLAGFPTVDTPTETFGRMLAQSFTDLSLLRVQRGEHRFLAAGVPWYVGLFGRDTLIPSIQMIAFQPELSASSCRALAAYQGSRHDDDTGEEPGKILHELRVGEKAHLHEISQTPSYAAVDSTLLFLIALARHVAWTGTVDLFRELRPNVDRALQWLERKAAENDRGYVTYSGRDDDGRPKNQSWRDSGNGVLQADGSYPEPPLAPVEVQGYAYQARVMLAHLLRCSGELAAAERLEGAADRLRENFLRDFWMDSEGCYCLALEQGGKQVASVTSNTAQVLWTGIATEAHAARIAKRITEPDMFSGWGVRTLSSKHPRYDPLAYQQGAVWPFDSSLIVSGLRRYGQDEAARRIVRATLDASNGFRHHRLPEFMAGMDRLPDSLPPHTPRADPLQAWSAAAMPFMTAEMLGLHGDGFARKLSIRRPLLPDGVERLTITGLEVAGGTVSLQFELGDDGRLRTAVLERRGGVEVEVHEH